jgi:hypothetical protein
MVACIKCQKEFDPKGKEFKASISGSVMGDEYIETYYFCEKCNVYTREIYHDRFLGEEEIFLQGPISREQGDADVALIKKCKEPWNKKCRCDAHMEYFRGNLD